jgi:hypothetical protein
VSDAKRDRAVDIYAARVAAAQGLHDLARELLRRHGISYVPAAAVSK